MWIAACDDDENFIHKIKGLLPSLVTKDDQLTFYLSGFELLDAAYKSKHQIDMLLLDIEMPGFSGIESAHDLRRISPHTIIVIITNYAQYAIKCYEFRAFSYLLKPINPIELQTKITEVRDEILSIPKKCLSIKTREIETKIPYGDIIFIESLNRRLYVHTRANQYSLSGNLTDMAKELKDDGFFRIHKSYTINLSYIKYINKKAKNKSVMMTNDKVLPIGDRNLKELFISYIENNY